MLKKILAAAVVVLGLAGLAACGSGSTDASPSPNTSNVTVSGAST